MITTFFIIFVLNVSADGNWSPILFAQSKEELLLQDQRLQQQRYDQRSCEVELRNKWFPAHCFEILYQGMSQTGRSVEQAKSWQEIKSLCVKRGGEITNASQLEFLLTKEYIRGACRKVLQKQLEDLRYMNQ